MDNFILEKLAPLLRRPVGLCSLGGAGARGKVNIAMTPTAFRNLKLNMGDAYLLPCSYIRDKARVKISPPNPTTG